MSNLIAAPTEVTAGEVIKTLNLTPHPEGGWYRQTWVEERKDGQRPSGTAIYYLLEAGQRSHWHKVDAVEIWHFHAGAPLCLLISKTDQGPATQITLGPDIHINQRPQAIVPKHFWQSAHSTGAWTLTGCTVSPGFRFAGFELADKGFDIPVA
jgi:uncharacterized protein